VSGAGNKLLFDYTTAPTPWLYDEQGASRARRETVLDDGRDGRNTSSWIRAIFLSTLVLNLERIFYFMKSLQFTLFQSNVLKMKPFRSTKRHPNVLDDSAERICTENLSEHTLRLCIEI
jgi:hypothetical protein